MALRPAATSGAGPGPLELRRAAQSASGAFPPLLVAAQRIANATMHGAHGRRRSGPGEDFWQYRRYSPGDAAAQIDWRKSARADRVLIRENEWEATNTLWIWVCQAAGMGYRSRLAPVSKHDRAVTLGLATAILAVKAGERVAAIGAPFVPGSSDLTINRMAEWYAASDAAVRGALPPPAKLARFSTCLLIGDFYSDPGALAASFAGLSSQGINGHVVQVIDPAEEAFPFEGHTEFAEFAGERKLPIGKPETLKNAYREKFATHHAGLMDLTRRLGWTYMVHHTDQPAERCLMPLYGAISQDDRVHRAGSGRS